MVKQKDSEIYQYRKKDTQREEEVKAMRERVIDMMMVANNKKSTIGGPLIDSHLSNLDITGTGSDSLKNVDETIFEQKTVA